MPPLLSVQQFLTLVNDTLGMIPSGAFLIEGEVAEYKIAQQKWITFTLKDEQADARVPCFATTFKGLPQLADGMRVRVAGFPSVFARFGKFSLTVDSVELVGEGALQKAYLALKASLEKEGLFSSSRKRSLPKFPERIGLITSREAAAYGDFLRILGDRMGGITVLHKDVHVQGQYAVEEIVQAFAHFSRLSEDERPEVLVLTRGGGGLEELHAFNDERVVRAIFSSPIPVIVGVGHERDETLCDFVADVRASTPSNAAERLVPARGELSRDLEHYLAQNHLRLTRAIHAHRGAIDRALFMVDRARLGMFERISNRVTHIDRAFSTYRLETRGRLLGTLRLLEGVNPRALLSRGYSIVRNAQGKVLSSPEGVANGEDLSLQFAEGTLRATANVSHTPKQHRLEF